MATGVKRVAGVVMLLVCSASMYVYWKRVPQNLDAIAPSASPRQHPLTDLYAQWFGTRELLLHHRDPYSDEVTRELQAAYYGKTLDDSEASGLTHQQRFAYPLYVVLLLAPTVNLQFRTVQIIFWWLLAMATAGSVHLWARALCVRLSPTKFALILVVVFTAIPVLQGLDLLQIGLLVAALLSAAAAATAFGNLFLAGVLLAFATIKPQMSVLTISWFVLWMLGDWRGRGSLLWGFATTFSILSVASELLLHGWVLRFLSALVQYDNHTQASSLLGLYLPAPAGRFLSLILLLIVAIAGWKVRHEPANSWSFGIQLTLTSTLTLLIIPTVAQPFNQVLLLPAILLVIRHWRSVQQRGRAVAVICVAAVAVGLLPWFFALAMTAGLLLHARTLLSRLWFAPLNASLLLPFAVLTVLILLRKLTVFR